MWSLVCDSEMWHLRLLGGGWVGCSGVGLFPAGSASTSSLGPRAGERFPVRGALGLIRNADGHGSRRAA